jgi:hypothetical protein
MVKSGWHVFNYHHISAIENPVTIHLGGSIRPEILYHQLKEMSAHGELISVEEGIKIFETKRKFDHPFFSVWFDDGFSSVKENAFEICEYFGVKSAISICSDFVLRKKMFWRAKYSILIYFGHLPKIKRALEKIGKIKSSTIFNFSLEENTIIDNLYDQLVPKNAQEKLFEVFDDIEGITYLKNNDWLILNHSSSHFPIPHNGGWSFMESQYERCNNELSYIIDRKDINVLPFDYGPIRNQFNNAITEDRIWVRISNKSNPQNITENQIHRYTAPQKGTIIPLIKN